ncbi:MAG: cysteine desulfurase [Bacilli bacterium]|nr:cysteine desulfurase [Bacilli bacterium]
MIYLDYSATTPVDKSVLDSFNNVSNNYIGNPNSLHKLGLESKKLLDAATKQVADLLKVNPNEVIFTSGASEANNLAIFGVINEYKNRGRHIITTKLEHSSVLEPMKYLEKNGYKIDYVNIDNNGKIDLNHLKSLLSDETILVSICEVNSEIGLIQDVKEIGKIINNYPKCIFHVDGTQAIGKKKVNLDNIDLYSFSAHKFYGLKGVGCLIKKKDIELLPIIHGGKSQTIYRSGTPTLALDVSLAKALRITFDNFNERYNKVVELNKYLKEKLSNINSIKINSNEYCVPHIINISIPSVKPETMLHALESDEIYISTKTACSDKEDESLSVFELTKDHTLASSSIRISLSYLTEKEDLDKFINSFKKNVNKLKGLDSNGLR